MLAWMIFYNPVSLTAASSLWLVLPLCLSVAAVYKTVRTESLRRLPLEIAECFGLMVLGIIVLCTGLWLIQHFFQ